MLNAEWSIISPVFQLWPEVTTINSASLRFWPKSLVTFNRLPNMQTGLSQISANRLQPNPDKTEVLW